MNTKSAKLDTFLKTIDPKVTLEETEKRINEAINSYPNQKAQITNWDEFKEYMTQFYCHMESTVGRFKNPPKTDPEFEWGRCLYLIFKTFGRPSGEKLAFEMARTGNEGGLKAVLTQFAYGQLKEYNQNGIKARVYHFFYKELTNDEQIRVAEEYQQKYGHLLPSELTENGGARIVANFPKVLENHPYLIQRLRRTGQ